MTGGARRCASSALGRVDVQPEPAAALRCGTLWIYASSLIGLGLNRPARCCPGGPWSGPGGTTSRTRAAFRWGPTRCGRGFHWGGYQTWEIAEVPGRSLILIHRANRAHQVEGCIAVGLDCRDGAVWRSGDALNEQLSAFPPTGPGPWLEVVERLGLFGPASLKLQGGPV